MMTAAPHSDATADPAAPRVPLPVQILTTIFYAGFAISVSIVAMAMFGLIGVILAVLFAWQWGRLPALNGNARADSRLDWVCPKTPHSGPAPSGNRSFDAYRDALMARLEREQAEFESFLARLRDAKDKSEFDHFLDDRAATRREMTDVTPQAPA